MTTMDLVTLPRDQQRQGETTDEPGDEGDQQTGDRWPGKDGKLYRRRIVATMTLRNMTQRDIARELGVSKTTIVKDQAWNRAEWQARNAESFDRHVAESLHVLDRTRAFDLTTMEDPTVPIDARQAARVGILANHDRRTRLLGLDKPTKYEVAHTDTDAQRERADELMQRADELAARRQTG